jgi:ribosome-associated protein
MRRNADAADYQTKGALKRDADAALDLAKKLVALKAARLEELALDERTRELIARCQRITQHVAHKREVQYLAKHLRGIDTGDWAARVQAQGVQARAEIAAQQRVASWRDRLIDETDEALLGEVVKLKPTLDRQQLRQLITNARRERDQNAAPKSARALYRVLLAELNPTGG